MNQFLLKLIIFIMPFCAFAAEERFTIIDYKITDSGLAIVVFDLQDDRFKGFVCDKNCFDLEKVVKSHPLPYEDAKKIFHPVIRKSEYSP